MLFLWGVVLKADRNPFERPEPTIGFRVARLRRPRLLHRLIEIAVGQRVNAWAHLADAANVRFQQLHRRQRPGVKPAKRLRGTEIAEFEVRHDFASRDNWRW